MTSREIKLLKENNKIFTVANRLKLGKRLLDESSQISFTISCPNTVGHKNDDKKPSLALLPRINKFRCYACGIKGDVIDLVKLVNNCSFQEAIKWIDPNIDQFKRKYEKAKEYLKNRGLSKETLKKFEVRTGMGFHEDKKYEAIYFPVSNGKKYKLIDCENCRYKNSFGTKTNLFKTIINPDDELVVLCEGEFDAMIGWERTGYPFWTSIGGAGTFYETWVNDFNKFKLIVIAFDNDERGKEGAKKVIQLLIENGIDKEKIIQIEVPEILGKDWSDYFNNGMTKNDFDELVNSKTKNRRLECPLL